MEWINFKKKKASSIALFTYVYCQTGPLAGEWMCCH